MTATKVHPPTEQAKPMQRDQIDGVTPCLGTSADDTSRMGERGVVEVVRRSGRKVLATGVIKPSKALVSAVHARAQRRPLDPLQGEERQLVEAIARRAVAMADTAHTPSDVASVEMDITAVHSRIMPLRLRELLEADDFNFAHDVFGIGAYLNRRHIALEQHFEPRFARFPPPTP